MPNLVHVTAHRHAARLLRGGIGARSRGWDGDRGVYAMAVLPDFTLTHQWVRELRRWKPGVLVAVDVRIPDDEPVTVGRYGREPQRLTAAAATAHLRGLADPRGYEIFVPRSIRPAEVRRIRALPQGVGWRHVPDAHGRRPCTCPVCLQPGTPGSARVRRRFPYDPPPETKPQLMATLRAAVTVDDIVYALYALAGRRRGGAEELAYLADHPDPEVRGALADVLVHYRGTAARDLRARLAAD
ncbi:HEAT repeat domain-containing protein [Actinoplanes sichuanensis]|uniref:HEAT repeat domain-containing protein n=1 Tax=Actinoplanes sichuanensis TaxID=512349 RepID=A0ABW4A5X5_9ACTN|nr:HEAT repeat domain-containing protein [Actinoplanes sichuanensis]